MVRQASLQMEMEALLGAQAVAPAEEAAKFAVDGLVPRVAVFPTDVEQVAQVMRYAHGEGLAVIPWGGGTHMRLGNVPQRYDIALSLRRLDRVLEHEPADLTATCQAGLTLAQLQARLAQASQFLPLDPPHADRATLGGILAANISGPSRHAYGTARDWTIGIKVVTADGRIAKAGGRVVKNVAGYDLGKLYIGSLGTLAIIVEATFKLSPLPKAERTLAVGFGSATAACAFADDLHCRGLALRALDLLNAAAAAHAGLSSSHPYTLLIWLAGTAQGVQYSHEQVRAAAGAAGAAAGISGADVGWEAVRRLTGGGHGQQLSCRLAVLPSRLPQLLAPVEAIGAPLLLARPTIGLLYASWPDSSGREETIGNLRRLAVGMGGSVVVERCPLELKGRLDVFGGAPPSFELMRRVKAQFDSQGVLSPGRFLGRL